MTRGKDAFLEWISIQCNKNFIEIFAHLAYHEVRLIVENSIRSLSEDKSLQRISNPLTMEQITASINKRINEIESQTSNITKLKGEKLFIKEYVTYYEHKDYQKLPCKPHVLISRNRKTDKVVLKIKKNKLWYPLSKAEEMEIKQKRHLKLWKKEGVQFREARLEWDKLTDERKHDYTLRKTGEEEIVAYIKDKSQKPSSPYAKFIQEKVEHYSQGGNVRVKVDHKFFYMMFQLWLTLPDKIKQEKYSNHECKMTE